MSSEPTSALTFQDLILAVAKKLGFAYYGADGTEKAQIPRNVEDLQTCKDHVNRGIRMFLLDAPVSGWRCARPVAQVVLWPDVALDDDVTVSSIYEPSTDTTLITASESSFYASMEQKTLTVTDVGDLTIDSYVSATQVRVSGDEHWTGSKTFSLASGGNFTLPRTFGGNIEGDISYVAETNSSARIAWVNESDIRHVRETGTVETGSPNSAAVSVMSSPRRRWQLMVWPTPSGEITVEFPYELYFDNLENLDDLHPFGYRFDEVIRAAAMAAAEQDTEDVSAGLTEYYRNIALPNALRLNTRMAPRKLGYCGSGRSVITLRNFREFRNRPTVTYTTD